MVADVITLRDREAVAREAADRWVHIARAAVEARGEFTIALSGGSTPRPLYVLMASEPWVNQAPWAETHVFWGDERRVPPSDPDSNYKMAYDTLLQHVPIPQEQIYRMDGEKLSRVAARDYEYTLQRHFNLKRREQPRFDLILLGMGSDGHVASIFPGTRAVSDLSAMVLAYEVPKLRAERITLTLPVINHARNILILVAGEDKAEALYEGLHGAYRPSTYPVQAVQPADGTLTFLVDNNAAEKLPEE